LTGTLILDGGNITSDVAKTDYQVQIPLGPAVFSAGTWTATDSSNVFLITRTAANQTDYYTLPVIFPSRTTALKGAKLKSVTVVATLGGTLNTTDDDFQIDIVKVTTPTDASAPVGSVLAGDDTADYETAHNSKAKRLTAATHSIVVSIPTGEQAYVATGEQLYVRLMVKDNANADLTFVLKGATALFDVNAL
jgi:hypothetical protein